MTAINITVTNKAGLSASTSVQALIAASGGYDNIANFPGGLNRPVTVGETMSFIAPAAGGPSTPNDIQQTLLLVPHSGGLTMVAGQSYRGLDISGPVTGATGAKMSGCRIKTGSAFALVTIPQGCANCVIEDCEIDGVKGATDGCSAIITPGTGALGAGNIIRRCNIHGVCNGVSLGFGPLTIKDNWINALATSSSGHINGIQYNGGAGVAGLVIDHNRIENLNGQTDCVMIDDFYGAVNGVTVNNNQLIGGGDYSLYLDCHFRGTAPVNVTVTNNRVDKKSNIGGYWDFNPHPPNIFSGNVDDVTGKAI